MNQVVSHKPDSEVQLMSQLREILLKEDRSTLTELQEILNNKSLLSGRVNPIIEEHLDFLKHNFPKEYAKIVDRLIEQKLRDSQQQILDIVYPVMGKMITKFVNLQMQQLKEGIDAQINGIFSRQGFVKHVKNRILGVKTSDMLIAATDKPILEVIFILNLSPLTKGNECLPIQTSLPIT